MACELTRDTAVERVTNEHILAAGKGQGSHHSLDPLALVCQGHAPLVLHFRGVHQHLPHRQVAQQCVYKTAKW